MDESPVTRNFEVGGGRFRVGCSIGPRAHSKLIGRYGALLPLFRLVGVPCIAAFRRVKSLLCHHSDRPKLANRSAAYFADATSLTGVSSALVFSPCLLAAFS